MTKYKQIFSVFVLLVLINFGVLPHIAQAAGWATVGAANFSATTMRFTSVKLDSSDTPYVAYQDNAHSDKVTVMKFDGSAWVPVGTPGFSAGSAQYVSLAIDSDDIPYVAYEDGGNTNKATVMKWNGSSWQLVGTAGFSAGSANYISLALDSNDIPYVAYRDDGNDDKATVMKFNGSSWVNVGSAGFSATITGLYAIDFLSLAIDSSNTPYVAYADDGDNTDKVAKFNGTSWEDIGSVAAGSGPKEVSLALDSSQEPYLAYADNTASGKISVAKFNGTSFEAVGSVGFSQNFVNFFRLALDSNDIPYVSFKDNDHLEAAVMKFNGSSWVDVGPTHSVSSDGVDYTSIALDSHDAPYIAYASDTGSNAGTAVVKKFDLANQAPEAQNVHLTGALEEGQTLTGHYTYFDWESDPEGVSTFKWYRDGVAISGATSTTYVMTADDVGTNIQFEVTPVSQNAPTTGTSVKSAVIQFFTVNSLLDDDDGTCTEIKCTFRDAVSNATDGSIITFSVSGTIVLTDSDSMTINSNITIIGPGQGALIIDFNNDEGNYIALEDRGEFNVSGLTFINGPDTIFYHGASGATYNFSDMTFDNNDGGYEPIDADSGNWNFTNVTFSNNDVCGDAGAIYFDSSGTLGVTNSTFTNNTNCDGGELASAIALDGDGDTSATITNSTFSYNKKATATIFANSFDNLTITNSTFANNDVDGEGKSAGIYASDSGTVHIVNSTFYNNVNDPSYHTLENLGIYAFTVVNSILDSTTNDNCSSSITSLGHNIDSGTSCGFSGTGDVASTNPLLDTNGLQANGNGSSVQTIALLSGSPALDTGDDAQAPATDARGITRPQGIHSDIGAYELEVASTFTLSVSKTGTGAGIVSSAPDGIGCGESCSADYADATEVTLTATPSAGSTFVGWSGGACSGTSTCVVEMTDDVSITAAFNLTSGGGGHSGGSHTSGGGSSPLPPVTTTPTAPTVPSDCLAGYLFSPTTGKPCPQTTTPTNSTPSSCTIITTLKVGSTGADVKCLQTKLGAIVIDGIFGAQTKGAVMLFQKNHPPLGVDGIVGPQTKTALGL